MREKFAKPPTRFLLETTLPGRGRSRLYERPLSVISAFSAEELPEALAALQAAHEKGQYLAGFIAYEAGYALEPKLEARLEATETPLLWFVSYEAFRPLSGEEGHKTFANPAAATLSALTPELSEEAYEQKIADVLELIRAGDIYQANFTYRTHGTLKGDPAQLYARLRRAQPVAYSALIECEDWSVLSLSPELFFDVEQGVITARPMKGTAPRSSLVTEDEKLRRDLQSDPKQRAENLMILDLIRNDIARVSQAGSVTVPARFAVETYRTVHQMTSTVTARLKSGATAEDILRALFPCGSVTGAPKIRAMEILNELEESARGIYTGALGFIDPDGTMTFNVAIRTLFLTRKGEKDWQVEAGVGGGIVADSTASGEWAECQTKLNYLRLTDDIGEDFQLLETMRWSRGEGIALKARHLSRLASSAEFFAFAFDEAEAERQLEDIIANTDASELMLRLLLSRNGILRIEPKPLDTHKTPNWTFALAKTPISSKNPFLYHKTTRRRIYDEALAAVKSEGQCDEVLLFNEQGFLTEGSRTNLFLEKKGKLWTPPLEHGLLDGTLRRELIETGEAEEKPLTLTDLEKADAVYFGNSVRGRIRATLRDEN